MDIERVHEFYHGLAKAARDGQHQQEQFYHTKTTSACTLNPMVADNVRLRLGLRARMVGGT
jgi:hypothetical protein